MRKLVLGIVAVSALTFVPSRTAVAACHEFTVSASPATVAEGAAVTVTVTRDRNIGESHVDLSTVDESARGGSDFTALRQTVNFTTETSRTVQLQTINDTIAESTETLRLHLSNPGGCAVNPNFEVHDDVRVTINDNDSAAPAPTARSTAPTVARSTTSLGATTTTQTTAPSSTVIALEAETSTSAADSVIHDDDGGDGAGPLLAALGIAAVLGAGGFAFYRFRRGAV